MPDHMCPKSGRLLAIELTEKHTFFAGETIIGTIKRWAPIVDSEAVLTVNFEGSAKVSLVRGTGKKRRSYSQRLNFWARNSIEQEIYRGPVHIPENPSEPLIWSFAVAIPAQADESIWRQIENDAHYLTQDDPMAYELPATFASCVGDPDEFYIEYYLEATLKESKGGKYEALLPVTIRRSFSPTPISNFGLKKYPGQVRSFSTYRLDENYTTAELSFKQKAKELFHTSSVPTLALRLEVLWPSILQIGHPEPAPFHVRALLQRGPSSEAIRDTYPPVVITRFKVKLDEYTNGILPTTFSTYEDDGKQKWTLLDWTRKTPYRPSSSRPPSRQPSPAPSSHRGSTEVEGGKRGSNLEKMTRGNKESLEPPEYQRYENEDQELPPPDADTLIVPWETAMLPLDLGQALGLRVPIRPKHAFNKIQPSFTSLTIKAHHMLRWEMDLCVAGESRTMEGTHKVEVLGQSDDDTFTLR